MIKIAICDDNEKEAARIVNAVHRYLSENTIAASVAVFLDSTSLLAQISRQESFDILLLDIIMPNVSGLTIGKAVRSMEQDASIIYLTTSKEYAVNAFELYALQYIVKPFQYEHLKTAFDKALALIEKKQYHCITIPTLLGAQKIQFHKILYIEYCRHVLNVHLTDGTIISTAHSAMSLSEMADELLQDNRFLVPHRAFILNMEYVSALEKNTFTMTNGEELPVASKKQQEAKKKYMDFLLRDE